MNQFKDLGKDLLYMLEDIFLKMYEAISYRLRREIN